MRFAVVAFVAIAVGAGGCTPAGSGSTKDFKGDERAVADTIVELGKQAQRRRAADICNKMLSSKLRETVAAGGRDCAAEMRKAVEDADAFDLEVTDVTVAGATANARVKAADQAREVVKTFRLVKEGGGWRIDSFG